MVTSVAKTTTALSSNFNCAGTGADATATHFSSILTGSERRRRGAHDERKNSNIVFEKLLSQV
jgi:hypothetical protein